MSLQTAYALPIANGLPDIIPISTQVDDTSLLISKPMDDILANIDADMGLSDPASSDIPEDWSSIYLPSIPHQMDGKDVRQLIEKVLNLGVVKRVDITLNRKSNATMAFVHMASWNKNEEARRFIDILDTEGEWWLPEEFMREFNWWPFTTTIRICFKINLRPIKPSSATVETLDDNICRLTDETENLRKTVNDLLFEVRNQQCKIFQLETEIRNIIVNQYDDNNV